MKMAFHVSLSANDTATPRLPHSSPPHLVVCAVWRAPTHPPDQIHASGSWTLPVTFQSRMGTCWACTRPRLRPPCRGACRGVWIFSVARWRWLRTSSFPFHTLQPPPPNHSLVHTPHTHAQTTTTPSRAFASPHRRRRIPATAAMSASPEQMFAPFEVRES